MLDLRSVHVGGALLRRGDQLALIPSNAARAVGVNELLMRRQQRLRSS